MSQSYKSRNPPIELFVLTLPALFGILVSPSINVILFLFISGLSDSAYVKNNRLRDGSVLTRADESRIDPHGGFHRCLRNDVGLLCVSRAPAGVKF